MRQTNLKIISFQYSQFSEFLSGFRKRKQERRQKAREDIEKQVKAERKRIKQEVNC